MTFRLLGRGGAVARRFARRDDVALVDPSLAPLDAGVTDAAAAVADVVPIDPVEKTYRATVTRTVTQTAVVEFTALEGTDTMTLAQGLLETIPPETWVTQPADSWGYIDSIEEVAAAADDLVGDPSAPAALSRRYARKAAFDVLQNGGFVGTYEAETPDDAILQFIYDQGFTSPEEAAESFGVSLDEYLAEFTAEPNAEASDTDAAINTLSRRGRAARRYASKAAYDVTVDGVYVATYDAATADDALAAYIAEQGFATVDEAAAAAGLTVDEYLATILVTEAAPADSAVDDIAAVV